MQGTPHQFAPGVQGLHIGEAGINFHPSSHEVNGTTRSVPNLSWMFLPQEVAKLFMVRSNK